MKPVWFVFLFWVSTCSTSVAADEFLKLKQIQGQPLEARVEQYDLGEQTVTLTARDGREIVVAVGDLSAPDKRLIAKALERQLFQKPKAKPEARPETKPTDRPAALDQAGAKPRGANKGPVAWHNNLKQATTQALGTDTVQDDRPIVWFRVLGDLRGLM